MAIDAVLIGARGTSASNTVTTTSGTSTGGSGNIGLLIASFDPSTTHNTPTDSKSNTWNQIGTVYTGGLADLVIYQSANWTGGASHTATMTFAASAFPTLHMIEVTGAQTSVALDVNVTGAVSIAAGSSGGIASGTLAQAAECIIAIAEMNDGAAGAYATSTPAGISILSQESDTGSFWTSAVAKLIVSSTSSVTPTWSRTNNSSNTFGFRVISFREGSGAAPAPKRGLMLGVG